MTKPRPRRMCTDRMPRVRFTKEAHPFPFRSQFAADKVERIQEVVDCATLVGATIEQKEEWYGVPQYLVTFDEPGQLDAFHALWRPGFNDSHEVLQRRRHAPPNYPPTSMKLFAATLADKTRIIQAVEKAGATVEAAEKLEESRVSIRVSFSDVTQYDRFLRALGEGNRRELPHVLPLPRPSRPRRPGRRPGPGGLELRRLAHAGRGPHPHSHPAPGTAARDPCDRQGRVLERHDRRAGEGHARRDDDQGYVRRRGSVRGDGRPDVVPREVRGLLMRPNARPAVRGGWTEKAMRVLARNTADRVSDYLFSHPSDAEGTVWAMASYEHRATIRAAEKSGKELVSVDLPLAVAKVSIPRPWSKDGSIVATIRLSPSTQGADPLLPFPRKDKAFCEDRAKSSREVWVALMLNPNYYVEHLLDHAKFYLESGGGIFSELEDALAHEASHAVDDRLFEKLEATSYANSPTEVKAFMSGFAHEMAKFARAEGLRALPVSGQVAWIDAHAHLSRQWSVLQRADMDRKNKSHVLKGVWQHLVDEGYFAPT